MGGTHPLSDDEPNQQQYYGLYWGVVVEVNDPAKRGRIRALIAGLTETSSTWAEPVGNPGQGGGKHGFMAIPKIGATVMIGFIQGDFDSPVYWGGPPPIGQQLDGHAAENVVMQTETFRIVMVDAEGEEKKVRIETLLPGTNDAQKAIAQSFIEITTQGGASGRVHAVRIYSGSSMSIIAAGGIEIDAPVVNIKRRVVAPTTDAI